MKAITLISEKEDGSMNKVENITDYLNKKKIDPDKFVRAELIHGKKIEIVNSHDGGTVINGVDGLITTSDCVLGVTVADCLPVYISSKRAVGILHAGWKSLKRGIIEEAIGKITEIGERKEDLEVFIGPSIQSCHFEVKDDLVEKFSDYDNCFENRDDKIYLNLQKVAKEKLNSNGVKNVKISKRCTYCDDRLFSYRRDRKINNMLAVIKPI